MAIYYPEVSRTFSEYLLIPNLTEKKCTPDKVSLKTPAVRFKKGEKPPLELNIPFASAIMQAVSNHTMAIALAKCGGVSFIYGSQNIKEQTDMATRVKKYKAGFVISDSNVTPESTMADVIQVTERTGHNTIAVTDTGTANGKLMGLVTARDYRADKFPMDKKTSTFMTPFSSLIYAKEGLSLREANDMIWEHKLNCLPVIDKSNHLLYFVFRKDYESHKENPLELLDKEKRLVVGAGINTKDYRERVPALFDAGVDILCIDSSDGYSEWQSETIEWIKTEYGDKVKIGAGNVVDKEGFIYLADAGADFVKIGIGGGSICITREQKGIGRGQASALIEVAQARDAYFKSKGIYIPLCSDGAIVHDYHILLALAMGADFIMMGRYFARFDESPSRKVQIGSNYFKEYWGEGTNKARNWQRYVMGDKQKLDFEEGVDSYVSYAGKLKDNLGITLAKIKSSMCNCGALTIGELKNKAKLTVVSSTSIIEGGPHDVIQKEKNLMNE
ncbi:MAG: IMP dehydrogenase [Spirochaetales bacterium]|nr:IMP dehydrogenase [Spirochaetales bacterium]